MYKFKFLIITLSLLVLTGCSQEVGLSTFKSIQVGGSPTAGKVLQTNGTDSTWVTTSSLGIVGGGSGSSTPGGSDTQVQFNNNGAFAGDSGFTFNSSTDQLAVTNVTSTNITSTIIVAGSQVGIGRSPTAGYSLDVNAGSNNVLFEGAGTAGSGLFLRNTNVSSQDWLLLSTANTPALGPAKGFSIYDYTASEPRLTIDKNGNIGFRTISPRFDLQINSSSAPTILLNRNNGTITQGEILGGLAFDGAGGNVPSVLANASVSIVGYADEAWTTSDKGSYLAFFTSPIDRDNNVAASERMRITSGGQVGINTTTPSQTLSVQGALLVSGTSTVETSTVLGGFFQTGLGDCNATTETLLYNSTSGKFECGDDDTGGGSSSLTDTLIAFGSSANTITSSTALSFNTTTSRLIVNGTVSSTNALFLSATSTNFFSAGLSFTNANGTSVTTTNLALSGFTNGSILFTTSSGGVTQNNSQLFWNNVNNRLGIGITAPLNPIHVNVNQNSNTTIRVSNLTAGTAAQADFRAYNSSGDFFSLGIYSASTNAYGALTARSGFNYSSGNGGLVLMADNSLGTIRFATGGNTERMRISNIGMVGFGETTPTSRLHLAASTTASGGLAFGSDTNLYRSAADSLTTDDHLYAASTTIAGGFFQTGMPDCDDPTTSKLLYDVTTGKYSCGTDQTGGGVGGGSNWTITGGNLTPTSTIGVSLPAGLTIVGHTAFTTATGTSVTSTNLNWTTGTGNTLVLTSGTSTNFFSAGLSFTNLSGTNATTTNMFASGQYKAPDNSIAKSLYKDYGSQFPAVTTTYGEVMDLGLFMTTSTISKCGGFIRCKGACVNPTVEIRFRHGTNVNATTTADALFTTTSTITATTSMQTFCPSGCTTSATFNDSSILPNEALWAQIVAVSSTPELDLSLTCQADNS